MGIFLAGLFSGTLLGGFIASLFAINARKRGIEDAETLADEIEQDEKLEREYSG